MSPRTVAVIRLQLFIQAPVERCFDHDHLFASQGSTTLMTDVFDYHAPLGLLGRVAERLFLTRYMAALLSERNKIIKEVAEGDRWSVLLNT